MSDNVVEKVARALGRNGDAVAPPAPPAIPDSLTRMVAKDADLVGVFEKNANEQKIQFSRGDVAQITAGVVEFLKQHPIRRVALATSELLDRLGIENALRQSGFEVKSWDRMSLDELYDFDCAITDVQCAVAENATLVIQPSKKHGRGLSLVPMFHVAIVEQAQIIPDMVDLCARLATDPNRSYVMLITGPSKTADIEMNVVTGVHGPNVVRVFLIP